MRLRESRSISGPSENQVCPYSGYNPHPESGPDNAYGSNGIFIFTVPGRPGMGLHSGRQNNGGPNHPTLGCIRTTDNGTSLLKYLVATDPLTSMIVINNDPNAPQIGTQQ